MKRRDLFTKPDREQVPFNLSAPAITGKPFQAGQYSVAVQAPVPASQTSLGKLAATLGQINPAIKAYGQAEQATTDLQKTMFGLDFAQMTEKEKDLAAQRLKSEEKFNSKLRGEGYELNPVAEIYAKELIGADKSDEYMAFIEENKAQYIEDQVIIKGVKPSPMQINEFVEGLTTQFKKENQDTMSDPLMLSGFMRSTADYRNRASVQIAKEASDSHKNGVLIPQAAKALNRVSKLSDMEIPLTGALMSKQDRNARYQEAWTKTGPLTAADQKLVLQSWLNSMKPGLAQLKLEELAESGIKIGNESLRSEDPIGDTYYNNLQDELEDKALTERQEEIKEDNLIKNEAFNQYKETFQSEAYRDLSYEEKREFEEDLKREIEGITDKTERRRKTAGLDLAIKEQTTKRDKDVFLIGKMAIESDSSNMRSFGGQALGEVSEFVDEYIKNNDIKKENPIYNVIKKYVDIQEDVLAQDQSNRFRVGSPQYKTVELLGDFRRELSVFKEKLAERLVDAREGESIRIEGKSYEISKDNTLISKQEIFDIVLLEERGRVLEEITTKFKELIEENKIELDSRDEVVQQKDERAKSVKDLKGANLLANEELGIIRMPNGELPRQKGYHRRFKDKNVYIGGNAFQKIGPELSIATSGFGWLSKTFADGRSAPLTHSHLDAFESGLATGAYLLPDKEGKPFITKDGEKVIRMMPDSNDAPLLFANIRENYKNLKPHLLSDFNHFQELVNIDAHKDDKDNLENTGNAILKSRRFVGFSPSEASNAIEKGVISEGVNIMQNTSNGASYFEDELLGQNPEGRAFTIINYDDKEELQGIANKLGVSVDTLDDAQQKARQYYNGKMLPNMIRDLQQEIEREDQPLRETIETDVKEEGTIKQEEKVPETKTATVPPVPTMKDVKVDTKVSTTEEQPTEPEDVKVGTSLPTIEEEEEEEPEDVKVGTRVSTVEQLTLDFDEKVLDDSLVNFVKEEEKFIPKAYDDFKQISIGYGTRAKKGEKTITKEEASRRLAKELNTHAKRVKAHAKKYNYKLNQNQMNALISFDYNTGSISELTNNGTRSLSKIAEMMLFYWNAGGKKKEGLVKRRIKEQKLFLTPMSKDEKTQ